MLWRIFWGIVLIWVLIWAVNNPGQASADVHNAWHVLFSSAGQH